MFLSHSTFRKRVKQEYTRLCQAKRAKILSDVRSEIHENRSLLQQLVQDHASRTPPPVKPLPPELCSGVELVRNVSINFTNANGKTSTVKVRTSSSFPFISHATPSLPHPHPSPSFTGRSADSPLLLSLCSCSPSVQHVVFHSSELLSRRRNCSSQHSLHGRGGQFLKAEYNTLILQCVV